MNSTSPSRPHHRRRTALVGTALGLTVTLGAVATADAAPPSDPPSTALPAPAGRPHVDEDGNTVLGSDAARRTAAAADRYIVEVVDEHALADVVTELADDRVAVTDTWDEALTGFTASMDAATVRRLRRRDGVVAVERDRPIHLDGLQRSPSWNLDRIDQRSLPLDRRYSYRASGAGVTSYVIDTGIRPTHADFRGRIPRGAYVDFGDGRGINDCNGHGTHVAGTIGGTTWGVAKSVTIVPVKAFDCEGSSWASIVVGAADWVIADHRPGRPAVVNMSFGFRASTIVDRIVTRLVRDGITVVVAAGNDAAPTCNASPARVRAAITVAASTRTDDDAAFSNFGECNDLFAPGVDVRSASHASNTGSTLMSGTSMAAPHVTGAAALILQRRPSATPAQVWTAINGDTTRGAISACCGDPNKLLHVRPVPARPSAPRSLRAVPANRSVSLSWAAPLSNGGARITDYRIQRSTDGGQTWRTIDDRVSSIPTALISGLTNGKRYFFRVAARNSMGVGGWSRPAAATPATKPSAPQSLSAIAQDAAVSLSWAAPLSNGGAAVTDYVVQQSATDGATWTTVVDGVSTVRGATIGGLTNGQRYSFRVAARNRMGRSGWSETVAAVLPETISLNVEDDGAIPLAGDTGIGTARSGVRTSGAIGDGPHGSSGTGTGDFDFYKVELVAGDVLVADASSPLGDLEPTLSVYGSDGSEQTPRGTHVELTAPAGGTYFVAVAGSGTTQSDPSDPASGSGAGSEGSYDLIITAA